MDNGAVSYRKFLDGDDNGMREIIYLYKEGLTCFINSYVKNLNTAEELCEDTFVKIGIKKPFNKKTGSFKTWLYSIGRNTAIDYLRRAKKQPVALDEIDNQLSCGETPEREYIRTENNQIVYDALYTLKSEYRQVLWLKYFENFSNSEISEIMKKNNRSVENLLYRAKKSLKIKLESEGFDYEEL